MKRTDQSCSSASEAESENAAVAEFHDLFHEACTQLANKSPTALALFNGCAHEGDRLLRLAFEQEDAEIAASIDDSFYCAYADSVFYIGMLSEASEAEDSASGLANADCTVQKKLLAMDTAVEIYQNVDAAAGEDFSLFLSLRKERCTLVKEGGDFSAFFCSSACNNEVVIEFLYLTAIALDWNGEKPGEYKQACCSALYKCISELEAVESCFVSRLIAEVFLAKAQEQMESFKATEATAESKASVEQSFESALDWIEDSIEQAHDEQDLGAFVCGNAVNGLVLWNALRFERMVSVDGKSKKCGLIRGMLGEVLEVVKPQLEEVDLPVEFEAVLGEIEAFVAGGESAESGESD